MHQQLVICNAVEQSQVNVCSNFKNQAELPAVTKSNLKEKKANPNPTHIHTHPPNPFAVQANKSQKKALEQMSEKNLFFLDL